MRIKNLTNSPYHLTDVDGKTVILPAQGVLDNFDPHPMRISQYRSLGYFEITEDEKVAEKPAAKPSRKK